MLSNNDLCLHTAPQYVLLFLDSDRSQILRSYTLLL